MRRLLALSILILSGCSRHDVYNFGQSIGASKADCEAIVSIDEREACEAGFARDFETYQRERESL